MTKGAYVYIDVSQKQRFIYKENELRSSLFRSLIIKSLTENLSNDSELKDFEPQSYTTLNQFLTNWGHEFVFSGGGNSIIYFPNESDARSFVYQYTIEVMRVFPELELYMSLVEETENLVEDEKNHPERCIRDLLHSRADHLKDYRANQFRRWSYGIEKIDATGMPIRKLSKTAKEAIQNDRSKAQQTLMARLEKQSKSGEHTYFTVTNELQKYRKNKNDSDTGKSYIGIINIDGNQMGQIVNKIDRFEELKQFGRWIENVYFHAVSEALKNIQDPDIHITPIVMAGDDICLITNAEYALELADKIVRNIMAFSEVANHDESEQSTDFPLMPSIASKMKSLGIHYLSACAGVAFTRITYPFYESIKAAEDLCKKAKEAIHQVYRKDEGGTMPSMIDWEVVLGQINPAERYEEMIQRTKITEKFHIKPLQIMREEKGSVMCFSSFFQLTQRLIKDLENEKISHSELEKVRRAAYNGPDAYRWLFQIDQTGRLQQLMKHVDECFSISSNAIAPILEEDDAQTITYLLHDVLEILPYMRGYWSGKPVRKGDEEHAAP